MKRLAIILAAGSLLATQASAAGVDASEAAGKAATKAKSGQEMGKSMPKPTAVEAVNSELQKTREQADKLSKGETGKNKTVSGAPAAIAGDIQKMLGQTGTPDLKDTKLPAIYEANYPTIYPEITTSVEVSSSDVNRFTCLNGSIKDVAHSEEKGILLKFTAKDAFVKFAVKKVGTELNYATLPAEFFVICDDDVYNMVLIPKRIPAQVVKLGATMRDKIKKNLSIFAGQPFEKKVSNLVRMVYSDDLTDSFTIERFETDLPLYRDVAMTHIRTITVEGEGLRAKEFTVELKKSGKPVMIDEKDFLRRDITDKPVAVSIDKLKLLPGQKARLIIVEHLKDKGDK